MNKAVREPVQGRDGAGTVEEAVVTKPWAPRSDGKSAILVSERATVFDRRAPGLERPDPMAAYSDPLFADASGASWTAELVHARFLLTGEVVRRMPGPIRRSYVSTLGQIALTEMDAPKRIAPTPEEITLADWTLEQIMQRAHRQVLIASAFGFSGDKIAKALEAKGQRISGVTVQRLYLNERRVIAGQWQSAGVKVDAPSQQRWTELFTKRQK